MRLRLEHEQVLQQGLGLIKIQLINLGRERLIDEQALQPRRRVGPHHRMTGPKLIPLVEWTPPRFRTQLEAMPTGLLAKHFGVVSGRQSREEALHGGGEGVVVGVGRGEERVASGGGEGVLCASRERGGRRACQLGARARWVGTWLTMRRSE